MSSFFKINHNLNLNRKNRRSRFRQKMIKTKNDNVCAKTCMIEKNVNTLLNLSNHQIENAINKKKMIEKHDFEITKILFCYQKKN
jgi:acetylornithine deacetylase/succinyl-diaminopimelate desuccinylase-like protein